MPKGPEIPDFLFNQHLTGYYDIPIPFCPVDVALSSEGVGSVFYLSVITSKSLFSFSPGLFLVFSAPISTSFTLLGWIPAGKLCYQ